MKIFVTMICIGCAFGVLAQERVEFYDTVLASVNGEPIMLSEVIAEAQYEESRLFAMLVDEELEEAVVELRRRTVDALIDRKLLRKEYKPEEYQLNNQMVETILDDWAAALNCSTRSELERWARRNNTTLDEMRGKIIERLTEQYITYRMFMVKVNTTPREIYEYFTEHKSEFATTAAVRPALIMIPRSHSEYSELVTMLTEKFKLSGDEFNELAAAYNSPSFRASGGDLGWLEFGDLRDIFAEALGESPEPGKVYGPVTDGNGTYFLKVVELRDATEPVLAELETEIRERLENEAREAAYAKFMEGLRAKAVIRYF